MSISDESVGPTDDTFAICGLEGFRMCYVSQGRDTGGQTVGRRSFTIRVYHEGLGIAAEASGRNQMKARNEAIFMLGSMIEAQILFSGEDIREEVQRFLDEDTFAKNRETDSEADSYEF